MDTLNSELGNNIPESSSLSVIKNNDKELGHLASQSLQSLGIDRLNQLVKAYEPFNTSVYVIDHDGNERKDENFKLKCILKEIPEYVKNAKSVGLTEDQSNGLVIHLLKSSSDGFLRQEVPIMLMSKSFEAMNQKKELFNKDDLKRFYKLVGESSKNGVQSNAIYAFYLTQEIGLPIDKSVQMISKLIDADGGASGYSFPPFCDALKTLCISDVNPDTVVTLFDKLGGDKPWFNISRYKAFEDIITFGCPTNLTTPQEVMETILKQVESGDDIEDALTRILGLDRKLMSPDNKIEIIDPKDEIERYFVDKLGNLELAALPYKTHKPFVNGVQDLERIAAASFMGRWEETGEGFWVYDNNSETWYSLGGQTQIKSGAVRHNMIPYDISELTSNPSMFHCHPQDFEVFITPQSENNVFPDEYRDHVTKFLSSTPSRTDYSSVADFLESAKSRIDNPRSYIVSSVGITEFIYPNDIKQIKEMSINSREIRDQALMDYDWDGLMDRYDDDELTVTKELIVLLNQKLPNGFSIKFYPKGSNIPED